MAFESARIDPGTCIGFGGTNARVAACEDGDISGFTSVETPNRPEQFFRWMARNLLNSSHEGGSWLVAGFPGPVSIDGAKVGPLVNVTGMKEEEYDLAAQLTAADSEVGRVLEQGFTLLAVNDGTLAAQAVASRIGRHQYSKTGALIIGTGIGAGVVKKDSDYNDVHRVVNDPLEIGHMLVSGESFESFEQRYSGPGLERRFGVPPTKISAGHPAWIEEGEAIGRLSLTLGILNGVDLVVPTGGIGIGASQMYGYHLRSFLDTYREKWNATQRKFMPEIVLVPSVEVDEFEMYGAEGVMRDYLSA